MQSMNNRWIFDNDDRLDLWVLENGLESERKYHRHNESDLTDLIDKCRSTILKHMETLYSPTSTLQYQGRYQRKRLATGELDPNPYAFEYTSASEVAPIGTDVDNQSEIIKPHRVLTSVMTFVNKLKRFDDEMRRQLIDLIQIPSVLASLVIGYVHW
jgi:hypothetical protein